MAVNESEPPPYSNATALRPRPSSDLHGPRPPPQYDPSVRSTDPSTTTLMSTFTTDYDGLSASERRLGADLRPQILGVLGG